MVPLIDVILPVHNAKKYLNKCLTSILNQDFQNIHLVIIDDGSNDNSIGVVNDIKKNANFEIEVFQNEVAQGVSKARNLGLKHLKGDYVTFVDADDWLNPQHFSNFINLLKGYKIHDSVMPTSSVIRAESENYEGGLNSRRKIQELTLKGSFKSVLSFSGAQGYLFNKLFKNSVLTKYKIQFDEELFICEDLKFVIDYLCYSKSKIITNYQPTYYYRINPKSVTQVSSQQVYLRRGKNEQLAYQRIFESISKVDLPNVVLKFYYQKYLAVTINLIFNLIQTGAIKQAKVYQMQMQSVFHQYFALMFLGSFIPPKDKLHLMVRLVLTKLRLGRK